MPHALEEHIKFAPEVWPGAELQYQPGDLNLFAPMGNGVFAPLIMMPWDDLQSVTSRAGYYSFHPHNGHPFTGAPITEAEGGTIYFDKRCRQEDVHAMLRLMGVAGHSTDYAAFLQEAKGPEDRYHTQMRIVGSMGLQYMFGIADDSEGQELRQQSLTIGEAIWKFIEHFVTENQARRYSLEGTLGGDGDWAFEALAFGFMVENRYHGVYRIWTRAWLVTK